MRGIYIIGGVHRVSLHFASTLLNHQATEVQARSLFLMNGKLLWVWNEHKRPESIIISPRRVMGVMVEIEVIPLIIALASCCSDLSALDKVMMRWRIQGQIRRM